MRGASVRRQKLACCLVSLAAMLPLGGRAHAQGTTFTRITVGAIATDGGDSSGCAWGDYDNDGFIDLFVGNNPSLSALYRNNGDGTFTKISNATPTLDRGYGCAWGDFNNDGNRDLFVANQSANYLYRNDGAGVFTKIAFAGSAGAISWSGSWADYNLD